MNITLILIDSLNRHFLSVYGPSEVATPNLAAFARRAWRFDNHFVGSLPCMPARREIFAGRKELMWRIWGPLEHFDARLPRLLEAAGYTTAIVTDHYHYWEEAGNGYLQSFQSAETVRGHEIDFWQPPIPAGAPLPRWVQNIEAWRPGRGRQYYSNVRDFKTEEDFFPAKVMTGAARWLREHGQQAPFFLQVESFDVHEPFHVPEPYASMYGDGAGYDQFTVWPPYQDPDQLARFMAVTTPAELGFIRAQYAGKLAMVDRWFGELLEAMNQLGLWDNTLIMITTDHGHDLGERGKFGKEYPHFDSHANIPLLIWHPAYPGNGQAITALTSTVDLFATILNAAGVPLPSPGHSQSFLSLLTGDATNSRPALLYGTFGQGVCCTDGEWTLFKSPERDEPLYVYSSLLFQSLLARAVAVPVDQGYFISGVDFPQWQVPIKIRSLSRENFLFHRSDDPGQTQNLWPAEPGQRQRMLDLLCHLLAQEGTPSEQYARLGLPC
ncbi:MAG: sulfatase [Chloroflexi bacterium]|nr:sulfatase [Chloroflexota bacterium]